jgi:aminopeptidase 2
VVPITYDVILYPYLDLPAPRNFTFDGEVTINVVVARPTKIIKMHAFDVIIVKIVITDELLDEITVDNYTLSTDDKHFFTITLKSTLDLGAKYEINIKYTGKLNDNLDGFYRSSYKEDDGTVK